MAVEQQCAEVLFAGLTDIFVITNCVNGKQYVGKANQLHTTQMQQCRACMLGSYVSRSCYLVAVKDHQ